MPDLPDSTRTPEVVHLPPPYARALPLNKAGKFLLPIQVWTNLIGGPFDDRKYRIENLLVDPDAEFEDGCLIVAQFAGGVPWLMGYLGFTGRDDSGRFVPAGDPRECYVLTCGLRVSRSENLSVFRIIGRYVGEPRRYPMMG